jgi:predicted PurR-regulated permease PerM/uncharacterized tellurite resistance protein B-like protein
MADSSSFLSRAAGTVVNPLSKAMGSMREVLEHHTGESGEQKLLENMLQLFVIVLRADGTISAMEQQSVATLVRDTYGEAASSKLQQMLVVEVPPNLESVCAGLNVLSAEEKETLLRALFIAAFADNGFARAEEECLYQIACALEISEEAFRREEAAALEEHNRRMKLVRSSTGLIASVVVIGIFVLTATFLKAVLFGLILAYFFQPLQQRYQSSFLENGLMARLIDLAKLVFVQPFVLIMGKVSGLFRKMPAEPEVPVSGGAVVQQAISRSCNAAVLTVSGALVLILVGVVLLTLSVKPKKIDTDKARTQMAAVAGKAGSLPLVGEEAKKLQATLNDPEEFAALRERIFARAQEDEATQKSLMGGASKALGAVVGMLSAIGTLALNTLLSIFFFSFFLGKLAAFRQHNGAEVKEGDYLVQSLFETSWLPTTSEETLQSAAEVINEVFFKLKTWVRGYMWIIIIETVIYVTVFLLLGVPYAIPLGMLAGLTVLLPFLGPMVSVVLTVGTCVVTGHADPTLLVLVGCTYVIMNMVVEQLFLYPAFVGEALGLNILETLIVVLLGGLFAGLAGMIFAVPVASVLKFLIPRLYQSMRAGDELALPESGVGAATAD